MSSSRSLACIAVAITLTACGKKGEAATSDTTTPAPAAAAPAAAPAAASATPADSTDAQRAMAEKQSKLDFATMEDRYLNDAAGQWAASATASSTYGDENGKKPSNYNLPANVAGSPDGNNWRNNREDMGFDWLETTFANPVNATEVRVVFPGDGSEAVTKVELQDTDGKWNTVWTGISDVARDRRGSRTWFVKTFEKTAYKVKAAKITIANNVVRGYKEVDAVQLVGN